MHLVSFDVQNGRANQSWGGAVLGDDAMNDATVREVVVEIAQLKPGVLALQEVREDRDRPVPSALAENMGMEHRRFATCRRAPNNLVARMFRRSRCGYGIAFATTCPTDYIRVFKLPSWRNPMRRASNRRFGWRFRLKEQGMAIVAMLLTPKPVVIGATHLIMKQPGNRKQLRRLEDLMARVARHRGIPDAPRIVLDDLDTHLEDIQKWTEYEVLIQTLTYPDDEPGSQTDHILGVGFWVVGEAAT